jgi:hypothetical protein
MGASSISKQTNAWYSYREDALKSFKIPPHYLSHDLNIQCLALLKLSFLTLSSLQEAKVVDQSAYVKILILRTPLHVPS